MKHTPVLPPVGPDLLASVDDVAPGSTCGPVSGWLLSGGQGRRMGGMDKGLVPMPDGRPMAWHTAQRLAPQVAGLTLNANRHTDAYATLGWPTAPDAHDLPTGFGPLVGMLTGLRQATTAWVQFAPCDYPHLPTHLVASLSQAAFTQGAEVAVPITRQDGDLWHHWTCALVRRSTHPSLSESMNAGNHRVRVWMTARRWIGVCFDDACAFQNINTFGDLR
jgi:molybdopterin-guanine dinucleotide biosynthesis protein A